MIRSALIKYAASISAVISFGQGTKHRKYELTYKGKVYIRAYCINNNGGGTEARIKQILREISTDIGLR